ncbi:MAG: DUF4337 domain-containing protein [Paucibacter sp.]|nr:DUF4337 domain-containing protein [Roseateles sp.]
MDLDAPETVEQAWQSAGRLRRLNGAVAVSVLLLASFMAICKVKDDNIVQAMQAAQADRSDAWGNYQARDARLEIMEATVLQLEAQRIGASPAQVAKLDDRIAQEKAAAAEQGRKKAELKKRAEAADQRYNSLNYRDDQFDLCDALLVLAIAMLAVTALTELWWMFWASMLPSVFGVIMGVAGLVGSTAVHPDWLIKLLD